MSSQTKPDFGENSDPLLSIKFPATWTLEEDPTADVPRTVSVTAAEGAFWSASIYPPSQSLHELQNQYVDALEGEYEDVELDDVEFTIGEEKFLATDFQFYCLDFLVHSRLIAIHIAEYPVLIAWQAEDRDFDKLEAVFMAITFSALQNEGRGVSTLPRS